MYLAESGGAAAIFWLIIIVIVIISKIVEAFRKNQAKSQMTRTGGQKPRPKSQKATGLAALLQALEQSSGSSSQSQDADDEEEDEEEEEHEDADGLKYQLEVTAAERQGVAEQGGTAEAESASRGRKREALRDASRRVAQSQRRAEEEIRRQKGSVDAAASADDAASQSTSGDAEQTSRVQRVAAAAPSVAFAVNDPRTGIIWSTILGRPRAESEFGERDAGGPPGLR